MGLKSIGNYVVTSMTLSRQVWLLVMSKALILRLDNLGSQVMTRLLDRQQGQVVDHLVVNHHGKQGLVVHVVVSHHHKQDRVVCHYHKQGQGTVNHHGKEGIVVHVVHYHKQGLDVDHLVVIHHHGKQGLVVHVVHHHKQDRVV